MLTQGGGGGNSSLILPGCVSINVMDMGLLWAPSEWTCFHSKWVSNSSLHSIWGGGGVLLTLSTRGGGGYSVCECKVTTVGLPALHFGDFTTSETGIYVYHRSNFGLIFQNHFPQSADKVVKIVTNIVLGSL